jgi:hypothetical protein
MIESSAFGKKLAGWDDRLFSITIKSQLNEAVVFPPKNTKKEVNRNEVSQDFGIMYEWIKDCVNRAELAESRLRNDPSFIITQKLNTLYCNCATTEAIDYFDEAQKKIVRRLC